MLAKRNLSKWCAALVCVALGATVASASGKPPRAEAPAIPDGAWLLEVEFPAVPGAPPPPPAFRETLTFHTFGTVTEINTLLNENSYNPALGQGCGFTGPGGALELNCNGSIGTGVWHRTGGRTLSFVVIKFLFDGETNAHVGYLRVSSDRIVFDRDTVEQQSADSLTEVLIGTDLDTAIAIPFGGADATGVRIR